METTSRLMGSLAECTPVADAYALTRPTVTTATAPRTNLWLRLDVESADVALTVARSVTSAS